MNQERTLELLRLPETYELSPHATLRFRETHISIIVLTGNFAYKVKKALHLGFLDFSTLDSRRHFCNEELRLNRRTAPELYLEVVALVLSGGKAKLIPGNDASNGEVLDYLVKMKEFPSDATFDALVTAHQLQVADVEALGQRIWEFHKTAETSHEIASYAVPEKLLEVCEENFRQTEQHIDSLISREDFYTLESAARAFIYDNQKSFEARIAAGKVKDCHGDLHLANIVLLDGLPTPFDCIEFNPAFRFLDTACDVAFTYMDLLHYAAPLLANRFLHSYLESSSDWELLKVLPFYVSRQSYVRGKVTALCMKSPVEELRAKSYFDLAMKALLPSKGRLVVVCGLSGTGKSTVARAICDVVQAIHLRSDVVRKMLLGVPLGENAGETGYSPELTERTYATLIKMGIDLAASGWCVVLDATFQKEDNRKALLQAAASAHLHVSFVECVAPLPVLIQRVECRKGDASDATAAVVKAQHFEPFATNEAELVQIDTTQSLDDIIPFLLQHLTLASRFTAL